MKPLGSLDLVCGAERARVEVIGVTPRCPRPSLDVRWPLAGDFVVRLSEERLYAIPKNRVIAKRPTGWILSDPREGWRFWWDACAWLPLREKKKRCPQEYWVKDALGQITRHSSELASVGEKDEKRKGGQRRR